MACCQNNGSVMAVSPHHCTATNALRNCCFNYLAGQSHKDSVHCTAVEEQPEAKEVHLPPLDLAWNPVCEHVMMMMIAFIQRYSLLLGRLTALFDACDAKCVTCFFKYPLKWCTQLQHCLVVTWLVP